MNIKASLLFYLSIAASFTTINTHADCFKVRNNAGGLLVGSHRDGNPMDNGCLDSELFLGISLKSGERIDKVVFQYENRDAILNNKLDAGSGGSSHSFNVYPHHITRVDTWMGKGGQDTTRVLGLRFTLSNGTIHGPYGSTNSREHYYYEVNSKQRIMGIHGRAGREVDAIGFYGAAR